MIGMMKHAQDSEIMVVTNNTTDHALSAQLYYILVLMVKDRALVKLRTAPTGNGFECWRLFCAEWEPKQKGRLTAMLTSILKCELKDPLLQSLEAWERAVQEY